METSVRRGIRVYIVYLANIVNIKNSYLCPLDGLVLDRTGTPRDVYLIIRELTHVEREGCRRVLHHQVLYVTDRPVIDSII